MFGDFGRLFATPPFLTGWSAIRKLCACCLRKMSFRTFPEQKKISNLRSDFPEKLTEGCDCNVLNQKKNSSGGEGGLRTPGTLSGTAVFKTACFNRSHASPRECCQQFTSTRESSL